MVALPYSLLLGEKPSQPGSEAPLIAGKAGARWVDKTAPLLVTGGWLGWSITRPLSRRQAQSGKR
jgi:hypothetical protein